MRVEVEDKDRYGRIVGRVFAGGVAVNVEMVRRGFAWWFRTYAKKSADLATAEAAEARRLAAEVADKVLANPVMGYLQEATADLHEPGRYIDEVLRK